MLYRQEASPNKSQPKLFHLITIWMGPAFVSRCHFVRTRYAHNTEPPLSAWVHLIPGQSL